MTTFNTGNPIGSVDPRDLYDNAENFDAAINDVENPSFEDRFGRQRTTLKGYDDQFQKFLLNSGYEEIGDYAAGLEITARNQIFRREFSPGQWKYHRANASLELPYTLTGDWATEGDNFVIVGDGVVTAEDLSEHLAVRLGVFFDSVASMLSSTITSQGEGALWKAGNFDYIEISANDDYAHLVTSAGVRLRPMRLPTGNIKPEQFGGRGPSAVQLCADAANEHGCAVQLSPGEIYDISDSDVSLTSPLLGGHPNATLVGRVGVGVGGGYFRGVRFEASPGAAGKLNNASIYLSESGVDIDVQECVFNGTSIVYGGDVSESYSAGSIRISGNVFNGTPLSSIVNAIDLTSTGGVIISSNRYLGNYYRFCKLSVLNAVPSSPVLEADAVNDVIITGNILKGSAGDFTNGPKQFFDLFSAGGRRVVFSKNISNPSGKIESVFEFKSLGTSGSEYPNPWHEEIIVSNNIVKGEFIRAFQAAGAYGATYEENRQKVIFSGNIIEPTNLDASYGIISSFMHNTILVGNIIEMASQTAYSVLVVSPERVKISNNQGTGYIAVRGDENDNPTPCLMASVCDNDISISTETTYGISLFNLDASNSSCMSITSNNVRHIGGTRESYRISNAPFSNGVVVGNSTSNNSYGLSTSGDQPISMRVAANSWAE